jgi:uncharacterized membrane protein YsdA (DUF1294 family)
MGKSNNSASGWTSSIVALSALALVMALATARGHSMSKPVWVYCVLSVTNFAVYAWDKSAARREAWRVSETKLHLLSLLGGWPGAIFAQQLLRHKSSKATFRALFWITVAVNLTVLIYWAFVYSHDF